MAKSSTTSLKVKFTLFTALIVIAICSGLFFFTERIFLSYLKSEMQQQSEEIATTIREQLSNFIDPGRVQITADRLLRERREISKITVYRRVGNFMEPFIKAEAVDLPDNLDLYSTAISRKSPFHHEFQNGSKEYWEFAYPILTYGSVVGLTTITLNFSQYKVLISGVRTGTLVILIIGLIAMLISMSIYMEITIRRPLAEIVSAMDQVKHSRFDIRVKPRAEDEIGQLGRDFNTMALALGEAQDEILRQNRILEQRVQEATSELRARNLELFEAQDELRRASRLATAGQIAATLAHDLGSPLSSISGHLQLMLEDSRRSADEHGRLRLLLEQVERLSDTIRNFLNNVTFQEAHFCKTDLNALLLHLVQLTGPLLAGHRIEPVLHTDPKIPSFTADPNQLQQLFLNLFTNAIDAMKEGGKLTVTTEFITDLNSESESGSGHPIQEAARIKVADTGVGMSPDHLKNLFRPFFSTKEFGKGTGLGLAICKEIVKAHKGQMEVHSELGKGTSFEITLPISTSKGEDYSAPSPHSEETLKA